MIRRTVLCVVLAVVMVGASTGLAAADDPTPAGTPTGPSVVTPPPLPNPSTIPSPGPTYVITPGVGGTELPPPSDPKAVEKAKKADQQRASASASPKPKPAAKHHGKKPVAVVAGPQTPIVGAPQSTPSVGLLWRGLAALVAMVVMFEITEVRRYLLRRRIP